jgi:hypothetical protein
MCLLVYKAKPYSEYAENKQYRSVCQILKRIYSGKDDMCLFLANFNFNCAEFDGIIIKNDAVIPVEFKNFGGTITARENGAWTTSSGAIVKGGSKLNPYEQMRTNRSKLWRGLTEGKYLPSDQVQHMPALIVFNQPITLNNTLSHGVNMWLHITDNTHLLHEVCDITVRNTDLSTTDILQLIEKLGLDQSCLDTEYSDRLEDILKNNVEYENADYDYQEQIPDVTFTPIEPEQETAAVIEQEAEPVSVEIPYGTLPGMSAKYIFRVKSTGISYKLGDVEIMVPKTRAKKSRIEWTTEGLKIKAIGKTAFEVMIGDEIRECSDSILIPWSETSLKLRKNDIEFAEVRISLTSDENIWREFKNNIANSAECFAADIHEQNLQLHKSLSTTCNPLESYRLFCSSIAELERYHKGGYISTDTYKDINIKWTRLKYLAACRVAAENRIMNELNDREKQLVLTAMLQYSKSQLNGAGQQ